MDITSQAEFAADPTTVYTMMTTKEYLEKVCEATRATEYEVTVTDSTTVTARSLPAPEMAARFTGPTLRVVEEIAWGDAALDGSRVGALKLTVPGQPLSMNGTTTITPGGPGSVMTMKAELKVSIPLLGRKLEQAAAPAVTSGFRTHQRVGGAWLTDHH
ncbi:MAG TPA: DUF2505 domain-containing protein [Dermatophilaceae bacterium]|nr:DUF2505 domain-containing protein [Dermatophilaceae bacterium]